MCSIGVDWAGSRDFVESLWLSLQDQVAAPSINGHTTLQDFEAAENEKYAERHIPTDRNELRALVHGSEFK